MQPNPLKPLQSQGSFISSSTLNQPQTASDTWHNFRQLSNSSASAIAGFFVAAVLTALWAGRWALLWGDSKGYLALVCHSWMLRQLTTGLLASAIAVAPLPLNAQDGSADDLGVMSIQLKDFVKPRVGFQGQTQAAGTPNQAGIGGFLPLVVGDNSVFFADVLANANFADFNNYSSIINTTVAGTTISTSSRLGYRWLNGDRSWMYGINAGYDTRPMATGYADTGVPLFGTEKTVFFQQAAVNAEAVSDKWAFNAYALIPTGDTEQVLNTVYQGGALDTYGLDAGYNLTPALRASVGYYYQNGDAGAAEGSGVLGRLAYSINNDLSIGANLSYDEAFDTRVSADIKWRFNTNGGPGKETPKTNAAVNALTSTPSNRDVRVHDTACYCPGLLDELLIIICGCDPRYDLALLD